jgi:hypothetical protein
MPNLYTAPDMIAAPAAPATRRPAQSPEAANPYAAPDMAGPQPRSGAPASTWSDFFTRITGDIAAAVGAPSIGPGGQKRPGYQTGFVHGALRVPVGAAQLLAHMASPEYLTRGPGGRPQAHEPLGEAADALARRFEQSYQKTRGPNAGFDWASFAGSVGAGALLPAAAGGPAAAALGGALGGATQPDVMKPGASAGDYWHEKAKDLAIGAATGGVFGGVGAAAARGGAAIRGVRAPGTGPVPTLARAGVQMTPGQLGRGAGGLVGKLVGRAEDALKSWPILGDVIRRAGSLSLHDFNRAVINQALDPIGKTLSKGIAAGRDAVRTAAAMISDEYDRILSDKGLRFSVDPKFQQDILGIYRSARGQPGQMDAELQKVFRSSIFERLKLRPGAPPSMDAAAFKMAESRLNTLATRYMRSPDVDQQLLGEHIKEAVFAMRSALERQNPTAAKDLANVNAAYAMLVRVEKAAGAAKEDGVFTPSQLLSAIRATDLSRRSRAFAHGDALMQAFAEAGQRVLPGKMPDSGTPERALWSALTYGLSKGTLREAASGAIPALTLGPLYTRAGLTAVQRWQMAGPQRNALISRLGGATGAGAADTRLQDGLAALNAVLGATEPPPKPQLPRPGERGPQGGTITGIGPRAQ